MKKTKIKSLLFLGFIFICSTYSSKSQTMNWNEKYSYTDFIDDFSDSNLKREKWHVNQFKRDIGLLIDSLATVKLNNGNLELTMINCPGCEVSSNGQVFSGYYAGGEIISKKSFQYGIFECRAKYAQGVGAWPAFWILGSDGTPCPPGSYANEIDIAEYFCKGITNKMEHNMHHYHPPENCNESEHHMVAHNGYSFFDSPNATYHVYKCIWTPNKVSYYIDEILKYEVVNNNQICSETNQYWYPEFPLQVYLSQQIVQPYNILGQEVNPSCPQTSYFDWVRVKKFFATPKIDCPNLICENGSATALLDVDSEATNITWALTPSSLFSGTTSGTGKTATVNVGSVDGLGKITYSFEMPSGEIFEETKNIWIGLPNNIPDIDIWEKSSQQTLLCPSADYYQLEVDVNVSSLLNSIDAYNWELLDGGGITWPYYVDGSNPLPIETSSDFTFARVGVYLHNACGWSDYPWYNYFTRAYNCGGYYMTFTPNPTIGETTLTIEKHEPEEIMQKSASTDNSNFDENTEWDMAIYSSMQTLKIKKTKLKGKSTTIQTVGWMEGIYTVRVKYNEQILTEKFVVKK